MLWHWRRQIRATFRPASPIGASACMLSALSGTLWWSFCLFVDHSWPQAQLWWIACLSLFSIPPPTTPCPPITARLLCVIFNGRQTTIPPFPSGSIWRAFLRPTAGDRLPFAPPPAGPAARCQSATHISRDSRQNENWSFRRCARRPEATGGSDARATWMIQQKKAIWRHVAWRRC